MLRKVTNHNRTNEAHRHRAVGAELNAEQLSGGFGAMWPEYNTGSYGGNMCSWDDIAL